MAPEQIDPVVAGCPVGTYTDVYGLGGVLYALLTGRPPYEVQDPQATMTAVLSSDPRRPRRVVTSLPPVLEAICLKAMARDPRRRYHTPTALAS